MGKSDWKFHLVLLAAFGFLALLLTWPTASHMTTYVPGDGIDDPAIVWNLWWVKYSLFNQPQNPLRTNFMFYPIGINLAFYTLTTLNGLSSAPLLLNFGPVTASNLHMWFTFAAGGYGAFLLTCYLLLATPWGSSISHPVAKWGSVLAGIIYAFGSSKLFHVALGQFNIASTHWIPFTLLFFIKMGRHPKNLRWALLTAIFLTMQAWTELTYASFLLIFMGLYWLYWLLADSARRVIRPPYVRAVLLLAALFTLGISPFLAVMLPDMRVEGDLAAVEGSFADVFSADLAGFLIPTMHHPLLGDLISQTKIASFDKGQQIYLGYTLLVLAGLGFYSYRRDPVARFWLLAGVTFAFLALGPQIVINGQPTGLRGLFAGLQYLPLFNLNRYPSRYSVMLLLSLAPLSALGFSYLAGRPGKKNLPPAALALVLASLLIFENLSLPLPQSKMSVPKPYQIIAQDADDFAVLDIPFGWRNGFRVTGAHTTGIMFGQFYQTQHQKPLLHGNTSRNPEFKFQYFTEAPVISSLKLLETGHDLPPKTWEADRQYAAGVLRFFNIKYIVVRPEAASHLNNPQATLPYIEAVLPVEKLHADSTLILYRAALPPLPKRVNLLTDSPLSGLYFAEGWGLRQEQIVAHRKIVRLLVPLNGQAQKAQFTLRSPDNDGSAMWLTMNDWRSEVVPFTGAGKRMTIDIPGEAVSAGLNEVYLHFSRLVPVSAKEADITVISAGEEGGNLGHIYLNGVEVSPNRRGYNIALIHPAGGLLEAATFDTFEDPGASRALANFLAGAPDEAIVAVAVADEASRNLRPEAVAALGSIGSQVDLRGQFRASHAFIGGKTTDRPLEASDPLQGPLKLSTGLGLVEPNMAAIFETLVFEAVE